MTSYDVTGSAISWGHECARSLIFLLHAAISRFPRFHFRHLQICTIETGLSFSERLELNFFSSPTPRYTQNADKVCALRPTINDQVQTNFPFNGTTRPAPPCNGDNRLFDLPSRKSRSPCGHASNDYRQYLKRANLCLNLFLLPCFFFFPVFSRSGPMPSFQSLAKCPKFPQ